DILSLCLTLTPTQTIISIKALACTCMSAHHFSCLSVLHAHTHTLTHIHTLGIIFSHSGSLKYSARSSGFSLWRATPSQVCCEVHTCQQSLCITGTGFRDGDPSNTNTHTHTHTHTH